MTDASQDTAVSEETPVETTETVEVEAQAETEQPTEAKAEAETGESESGEDSAEKETEEREKRRNSFQERINQKTREAKEYQAKYEESQQRLQEAEERLTENKLDPMPQLEDFGYDPEAHNAAMAEWAQKSSAYGARQARLEEQRQESEYVQQQALKFARETFIERSNQFTEDHPDYRETIQKLPNSPLIMNAALVSDDGPALAYHLGKNPELANRLANSNPIIAAMELGRISQKLATPAPTKNTQAPPPAKPVGSSAKVEKDPDKMSAEEYAVYRGYRKK